MQQLKKQSNLREICELSHRQMKLQTNSKTNLAVKMLSSPDMEMVGLSAMPVDLSHMLTRYQRDKLIKMSMSKIGQERRSPMGPHMLRLVAAKQFLELVHLKPELTDPIMPSLALDGDESIVTIATVKVFVRPERGEIKKPEPIPEQAIDPASDEDHIPLGFAVTNTKPPSFHRKSKSFSGIPSKPLIDIALPCPPLTGTEMNVPLPEMNFSLLKFVKFQKRRM